MNKNFLTSYRFWALASCLATVLVWSSCGADEFNLWKPLAQDQALKSDEKARLEETKVKLDAMEYDEALALVEPMIEDESTDSNDARLFYAAAKLGQSKLDLWSVIKTIVAETSETNGSESSSGGVDDLLNKLSDSLLGTGAERTKRIAALNDAVTKLKAAPDPTAKAVRNTSCMFTAFLAVPTIADAEKVLTGVSTALSQIQAAAQSGGAECPNITLLDTAIADATTLLANLSLVIEQAKSCPFIDTTQIASQMNGVEAALASLTAGADKGCASLPTCPAAFPSCQSLFPACVQELLKVGTSDALAGDGVIAMCEIVLHCTASPTACFSGT